MTNANAGHCESSFLKHPFLKRALSAASELALRLTSRVLGIEQVSYRLQRHRPHILPRRRKVASDFLQRTIALDNQNRLHCGDRNSDLQCPRFLPGPSFLWIIASTKTRQA